MSLLRIDLHPSRRQLHTFGLIWLVFFGVVAGVAWRREAAAGTVATLGLLAVAVPALGTWMPKFMRVVYLGMAYATFPIGLVVSWLLLATVYYLVLTPMAIVMRLAGYDPMDRRFDRRATSYWIPRNARDEMKRYFQQF